MNLWQTRVRVHQMEGVVRPFGARWLGSAALVVADTAGSIWIHHSPLEEDSPAPELYRSASDVLEVVPGPFDDSVAIRHRSHIEVLQYSSGVLGSFFLQFINGMDDLAACIFAENGVPIAVSTEGRVWQYVTEVDGWQVLGELGTSGITSAALAGGSQLICGTEQGELVAASLVPFGHVRYRFAHADAVQALCAVGSAQVCSIGRDRALRVWDTNERLSLNWSLEQVQDHFLNCVVTDSNHNLLTGSSDGTIAVTSIASRTVTHRAQQHRDSVRAIDTNPELECLVSVSDDGTYAVADLATLAEIRRHGAQRQYTRSADFNLISEAGPQMALGSTSGHLRIGALTHGALQPQSVSSGSLRALCYAGEDLLAMGDDRGDVFVAANGTIQRLGRGPSGVTAIGYDATGRQLVCGFRNGAIGLIPLAIPTDVDPLESPTNSDLSEPDQAVLTPWTVVRQVHDSIVGDVLIDPDSGHVLSSSDDRTIKVLGLGSLEHLGVVHTETSAINNLVRIGDHLVATTDGGDVVVLNISDRKETLRYSEHAGPVRAAAALPNGLVASGDRTGQVRLWNSQSGLTELVHQMQERVIRLRYDAARSELLIATESEVASLALTARVEHADSGSRPRKADASDDAASSVRLRPAHVGELPGQARSVELDPADGVELSSDESGLLRQFAADRGGVKCAVAPIDGGHSGARILRARVTDASGNTRVVAVAKIGDQVSLDRERANYDDEVTRLDAAATPRRINYLSVEGTEIGAIFYSLAETFGSTLAALAYSNPSLGQAAVRATRGLLAPWSALPGETRSDVRTVRRGYLSDDALAILGVRHPSLGWTSDFEDEHLQIRECTVHGDLHGCNVLVSDDGRPIIVDFGDVYCGPASLDPIALELSLIFHPSAKQWSPEWVSQSLIGDWRNDRYRSESPIAAVLTELWAWQSDASAGTRELLVSAYVYLLKQLSFESTDAELCLGFLTEVRRRFDRT